MSNPGPEYMRRRRAEFKAQGVCGQCCARPAKPGRVTCQICLDRTEAYRAEAYEARRELGLCTYPSCKRNAEIGQKCFEHNAKHRAVMRDRYAKRKAGR